jgi:hypothetical protein
MAPVRYPATLPCPQTWSEQPRERRATSGLRQPGSSFRARSRDYQAQADASWTYTARQMLDWRNFFDNDLAQGLKWFVLRTPGQGGRDVARQVRYASVFEDYLGLGLWRVSAALDLQRPVIIQPFLTSRVYPQESLQALNTGIRLSGGALREALLSALDGLDTQAVVSAGTLRSVVRAYGLHEALDTLAVLTAGELRSILKTYEHWPVEAVDAHVVVSSGSLRRLLIPYSHYPTESLDTACAVTGGSLA